MSGTIASVTIANAASIALVSAAGGVSSIKQVMLPQWAPGKFIYITDCNGSAGSFPFAIVPNSVDQSATGIIGLNPITITASQLFVSTFKAGINIARGSIALVAGGVTGSSQSWFVVNNNSGQNTFMNVSTSAISSAVGFISSFSTSSASGNFSGTFTGSGAGLTGVGMSSLPPVLSTTLFSSGLITASNVSTNNLSTNIAFISSLTVNTLTLGTTSGYINTGDLIANSLSTYQVFTSSISALNANVSTLSTSAGFGNFTGKFTGDGSGLTGVLVSGSGGSFTSISNSGNLSNTGTLGVGSLLTASNGISTTTISTSSAYIGALTVGTASDSGLFNVGGLLSANLGLNVAGAAFTTTGATTTHNNAVSITTGGLQVGGLATLSNTATLQGGLSTTTISTSSAYINTLTVNSESIASTLAVGGLITASAGANVTGGATIDATSTNIISSGSIYAGSFFYSVASY